MGSQNFRVKNGLEVGTGITISPNGNINSSGISTFNGVVIGGATTSLLVQGNARIIGILSVGQGTITFDGDNNQINVGSGITLSHTNGIYVGSSNITSTGLSISNVNASGIVTASSFVGSITGTASTASFATTSFGLAGSPNITVGNINSSGIVTASSFDGNASSATYASNSGIATYASNSGIATYATSAGIATYATSAGIATYATSAGIATYATNAGISTNVSGGTASVTSLSVSGISTLGTLQISSGIVTATSGIVTYYGDASNTVSGRWILGADAYSGYYTFTGIGFTQTTNDPTLYLKRGEVYQFVNTMDAHPFRIQSTVNGSTGTEYNGGITNNNVQNGTLTWNVQFDTPSLLYYQCTAHGSMGGKIYIIDAGIGPDISINTTGICTFSGVTNLNQVTETVVYAFNTTLAPSSGTLTLDTSLGTVFLGDLNASVTTWEFTNVPTTNSKATTITAILDGDTGQTYGDACSVNGSAISNGVKWAGGSSPTSTNNFDILSFIIVKDSSGTINVFGSGNTNFS